MWMIAALVATDRQLKVCSVQISHTHFWVEFPVVPRICEHQEQRRSDRQSGETVWLSSLKANRDLTTASEIIEMRYC
jgi:hypothetical protein